MDGLMDGQILLQNRLLEQFKEEKYADCISLVWFGL